MSEIVGYTFLVMAYLVGCAIASCLLEDAPRGWQKFVFIICWPVIAVVLFVLALISMG